MYKATSLFFFLLFHCGPKPPPPPPPLPQVCNGWESAPEQGAMFKEDLEKNIDELVSRSDLCDQQLKFYRYKQRDLDFDKGCAQISDHSVPIKGSIPQESGQYCVRLTHSGKTDHRTSLAS